MNLNTIATGGPEGRVEPTGGKASEGAIFTAAQVARGAGITRQAAHAGLDRVAADGQLPCEGRSVDGWSFESLPLEWQLEITRRGVKRGFENGKDYLSKLPEPWKCPLPWGQVAQHQRDKAVKLQKALGRALALRGNGSATTVEPGQAVQYEQAGLDEFKEVFGYAISGRHLRRLLHRTIERDAGEENWQRLEIYLDERAFVTSRPGREVLDSQYAHRELDEVFDSLESRANPTAADRPFLWDAVLRHYEGLAGELADKMCGPHCQRDWSKEEPGDWFSADDVTWNHYFKERQSNGRWQITRGECLVMTDLRTGCPLDSLLIAGNYNGEHIRNLVLRVHDQVGLPRVGFYFERGVWASRFVTGDNRQGTPVHWLKAENGLCGPGLNLEIKYETTPPAKTIEGQFHIIQDRMRCIPGFVGFNEREYDAERITPLKPLHHIA